MNRPFVPPASPVIGDPQTRDPAIASFVLMLDVPQADRETLARLAEGSRQPFFLRHAREIAGMREALECCSWEAVVLDIRDDALDVDAHRHVIRRYWPDTTIIIWGQPEGRAAEGEPGTMLLGAVTPGELMKSLEGLPRGGERPVASLPRRARDSGAAAHLQQLADNIPECLWLHDLREREVVYVNPGYEMITGYRPDERLDDWRKLFHCVHVDDVVRFAEAQARAPFGGLEEEFRIRRPDGELRWVHLHTFAIRDAEGLIAGIGGIIRDVSGIVEQKAELYQVTHFDDLTALPNRMLIQERLAASVALARRNGWLLGLLLIDIDRFKIINDTLGHAIGDELLRQASRRLRACLRDSDVVGRMGGDEFAVILPDMESAELAAIVARKVVEVMAEPFVIEEQELFVSASVGISLYPDDAEAIDVLVRNADAAMYRAKDAGRNAYAFYTAEMNARARRRLGLETDLRQALARGEFELHYQPKVNCHSGKVAGVEALIRWRHPQRGLVGPNEFIPLLEETGLIVPVGDWVMLEACRQMRRWHQAGFDQLDVAVNVSARQMEGRRLIGAVHSALAATDLPAAALELELTESLLMRDPPAVAGMLGELKSLGLQVAVDDFGTGYSSLSYLKRFPLDNLKVDRAFVQDIAASAGDASITRAVIHMGHELALKVVAEGVETAEQLEALRAAGCDEIQGYYFSKPLPAAEITALLDSGKSLPMREGMGGQHAPQPIFDAAAARALADLRQERDRLAAAADAARLLWRQTLDACEQPVVGVDRTGQVVFTNAAADLAFGEVGLHPGAPLGASLPALAPMLSGAASGFVNCADGRGYSVRSSPLQGADRSGGALLWFARSEANS
jgi:diguanylate cyclase (GGDEF)-like protein/PAS domain S-box-containing protein